MTGSLQLHEYPGDIVRLFCEKCVQLISALGIGHTENLSLQSGNSRVISNLILSRSVSTDKQPVENQLRELRQIAERRGWQIVDSVLPTHNWHREIFTNSASDRLIV